MCIRDRGGLIFAASSGAGQIEQSAWWRDHPWVGVVAGIALAGTVHTGKALSRPLVNAGTAGIGAPFVSAAEDLASVGTSLVAIFIPILVLSLIHISEPTR